MNAFSFRNHVAEHATMLQIEVASVSLPCMLRPDIMKQLPTEGKKFKVVDGVPLKSNAVAQDVS